MYLRVMADYCTSGLWDREGYLVNPEDYSLTPETILALSLWCAWYEKNDDYLPFEDRNHTFDIKAFSEQGLIVANMIKHDLPDYEIVYFDEYKLQSIIDRRLDNDRLKFEYPV